MGSVPLIAGVGRGVWHPCWMEETEADEKKKKTVEGKAANRHQSCCSLTHNYNCHLHTQPIFSIVGTIGAAGTPYRASKNEANLVNFSRPCRSRNYSRRENGIPANASHSAVRRDGVGRGAVWHCIKGGPSAGPF